MDYFEEVVLQAFGRLSLSMGNQYWLVSTYFFIICGKMHIAVLPFWLGSARQFALSRHLMVLWDSIADGIHTQTEYHMHVLSWCLCIRIYKILIAMVSDKNLRSGAYNCNFIKAVCGSDNSNILIARWMSHHLTGCIIE